MTEHWQKQEALDVIKIMNFKLASSYCRKIATHGGSVIYIRNDLECNKLVEIEDLSVEGCIEISAIELLSPQVIIVCIYRPPSGDFDLFADKLEVIMNHLLDLNKPLYMGGDFNLNQLEPDVNVIEFNDILISYGCIPLVLEPTRIAKNSATCIDNVIVREGQECSVSLINSFFTDHYGIHVSIPLVNITPENCYELKRVYLNDKRKQKLKNSLLLETWNDVYNAVEANDKYEVFHKIFMKHLDDAAPVIKKLQKNDMSNKSSNWIDKACLKFKEHVKFCHELHKSYPNDDHFCSLYKTEKSKYIDLLQSKKGDYLSRKIVESDNKSKAVWNVIKETTNFKNDDKTGISEINISETEITNDPKKIADLFSDYFVNVVTEVKNQTVDNNADVTEKITEQPNSMFFEDISAGEILDIIKNLNNSNSSDIYNVNTEIIKYCSDFIVAPLLNVFQCCVNQGIFPEKLKSSKIVPVHKKGNKKVLGNYRPIAILPIKSKILEKLICNRLVNYFEKFVIFSSQQHGYRNNRSTTTALYEFLMKIYAYLEKGEITSGVFVDLSKAFDCVDHKKLLKKLEKYGVRGVTLNLFKSYLLNRKQKVYVKNKLGCSYSNETTPEYGVPQGSILGPVMYIIYTNDLDKYVTNGQLTSYADDTNKAQGSNNVNNAVIDIKSSIAMMKQYFAMNGLAMNENKTAIIHFKLNNCHSNMQKTEFLMNNDIILSTDCTILGLILDENLNWSEHIAKLSMKLCKITYALRIIRKNTDLKTAMVAYSGYFLSILSYGVIFYGSAPECYLNRVFKAQKRAIRTIFNLSARENCKPYFIENNILTLPCLYILEVYIFVKKNFNLFSDNLFDHGIDTRNKNNMRFHSHSTTKYEQSVLYMGLKFYNKLPVNLKTECSFKLFKSAVKKILLKKAYYNVTDFLNDNYVFV
jgi:Reverse transcriptase (RNA-dependent DNA polymerase)